jgi:ankyrin repeat protein
VSGPESVRRRVPRRHFSAGHRHRRRQVGNTAFLFAAKSADVEVMRLLVENGADPKMNTLLNITPLMLTAGIAWAANQDTASEEQVLDAVKYLVEELGADVNFVADTGETAMHAAAYRGAKLASVKMGQDQRQLCAS